MLDITGKCALVTGASGDIGRAIAEVLHGQGAVVALSGTREAKLEDVAGALGERAHVCPGNLADAEATASLFQAAESAMGQVDILVNNAGMTRDNLSMRMKDEDFVDVLEVNLVSAFRLTRAAMKGMMRRRWGRVIGVTSVVGFTGNPGQANYAASKAGMVGMTKSIANEVANRGVTVNCIAPGFVASAMTDALTDDQKSRITDVIPMARMGLPIDIANGVAYLASEEAGYVTGQTLHVNGGMAML